MAVPDNIWWKNKRPRGKISGGGKKNKNTHTKVTNMCQLAPAGLSFMPLVHWYKKKKDLDDHAKYLFLACTFCFTSACLDNVSLLRALVLWGAEITKNHKWKSTKMSSPISTPKAASWINVKCSILDSLHTDGRLRFISTELQLWPIMPNIFLPILPSHQGGASMRAYPFLAARCRGVQPDMSW